VVRVVTWGVVVLLERVLVVVLGRTSLLRLPLTLRFTVARPVLIELLPRFT
jgi:hypothetical protein